MSIVLKGASQANDTNGDISMMALSPVDCVEYSTLSESHWIESRNRGCLSKTGNGKHKYFSRIRELTHPNDEIVNQIQTSSSKPLSSADVGTKGHGRHRFDMVNDSPSDIGSFGTVVFSPSAKSVAILEDMSQPPHVKPSDQVMLLSMDEFLSYLQSPDWCGGGHKVLRILHGPVLHRIQMALHALEARGKIVIKTSRAILNTGQWSSAPSTSNSQSDTGDATKTERKMSTNKRGSKQPDWRDEKILVDMFYYGKGNDIQATDPISEEIHFKTMGKLAIKQPVAHKLYPTGRLNIPKEEHYDQTIKIENLEAELQELILRRDVEIQHQKEAKKTDPKKNDTEKLDRAGGKGKGNENEYGGIDDVAEDPYLVPEVKINEKDKETEVEEKTPPIVVATEPIKVESSASDESKPVGEVIESEVDQPKTSQIPSRISNGEHVVAVDSQALAFEPEADNTRGSKKSILSSKHSVFVERKETTNAVTKAESESIEPDINRSTEQDNDIDDEDENDSTSSEESLGEPSMVFERKNRLYLSGKELYVSSVYSEKDKNAQPIMARLQEANKRLMKRRVDATKTMYDKLYNKDIDLRGRFKTLALAREIERRRRTGPQVPKKKLEPDTVATSGQELKASQWDKYVQSQENMEIRAATHGNYYRDFMKRMREKPHEDDILDRKGKVKPNKNVNANVTAVPKLPIIGKDTNKSNTKRPLSVSGRYQTIAQSGIMKTGVKGNLDLNNNQDDDQPANNVCKGNHGASKHEITQKHEFASDQIVKGDRCTSVKGSGIQTTPSSCPQTISYTQSKTSKYTVNDRDNKSVRFQIYDENNDNKRSKVINSPRRRVPRRKGSTTKLYRSNSSAAIVRAETDSLLRKKLIQLGMQLYRQNRISFVRNQAGKYKRRSTNDHNRNSSLTLTEELSEKLEKVESDLKESNETETEEPEDTEEELENSSVSEQLGPTESRLIEQALNEYSIVCKCLECIDDEDELYKILLPKCQQHPFTYPVKLGCLKRSYKYLSPTGTKPKTMATEAESKTRFQQEITDQFLRDAMLNLLDTMVIRKDIVVSSLGKKLTTFVFINTAMCPCKKEE